MALTLRRLNITASDFARKLIATNEKAVLKGAEPLLTALRAAIKRKAEAQGALETDPNAVLTEAEMETEYEAQLSAAEGRTATEGIVLFYYAIKKEVNDYEHFWSTIRAQRLSRTEE